MQSKTGLSIALIAFVVVSTVLLFSSTQITMTDIVDPNQQLNKDTTLEENQPEEEPLPQIPIEQKSYTIAVLPLHGAKVYGNVQHPNIKFVVKQSESLNLYNRFGDLATYDVLFDYNIRPKREEYSYEQYKEDIAVSVDYYQHDNENKFKNYDFIFVPPIGLVIDDQFAENFYNFINEASQRYPDACYYQAHADAAFRKDVLRNSKYMRSYVPEFPKSMIKAFGGMIVSPRRLYLVHHYGRLLYHISRIDENLQVYCEINYSPIIVSPNNVYPIVNLLA